MLDPSRNVIGAPIFAIQTTTGLVEARGTFYAIAEYKGQTYTAVKRGSVYKRETPPTMRDFASYVKNKRMILGSPVSFNLRDQVVGNN